MPAIEADYDQVQLFPPCLEDWVGAEHPARFVRCFVEGLDLGAIGIAARDAGAQGRPGYAPALLLRVWLYGYFKKVRSSRGLECACREDVGFIWLCGGNAPDHNTLWRFWDASRGALRELFKASVATSCRMGLVGFALQALDGTKIQAACSAGAKYDAGDLADRIARLDLAIAELEGQIEEAEAAPRPPAAELPGKL